MEYSHLGVADIDLWVARPNALRDEALLERWRSWLAPDERARLAAFCFDVHRHEYLVTRGLVRAALSSYRATRPEAWQFRKGAHDRPFIEPDVGIRFNLSNAPALVVCAVSETHEVGVDVEPLSRAPEILDVAHTVFSTTELAELRGSRSAAPRLDREATLDRDEGLRPPSPREASPRIATLRSAILDRAVSLWTTKEAYIKARSIGMSLPLREITMRFEGERVRLELTPVIDDDASAWWIRTRDIDEHRVALAVRAGADATINVRVRELSL
jgi:4'-phosphopantetheinyl transferase